MAVIVSWLRPFSFVAASHTSPPTFATLGQRAQRLARTLRVLGLHRRAEGIGSPRTRAPPCPGPPSGAERGSDLLVYIALRRALFDRSFGLCGPFLHLGSINQSSLVILVLDLLDLLSRPRGEQGHGVCIRLHFIMRWRMLAGVAQAPHPAATASAAAATSSAAAAASPSAATIASSPAAAASSAATASRRWRPRRSKGCPF